MSEKPKFKRTKLYLLGAIVSLIVELVSYLLGRTKIWVNDIWVFATFIVLTFALLFIRARTTEKAELEALAMAYEAKKIDDKDEVTTDAKEPKQFKEEKT